MYQALTVSWHILWTLLIDQWLIKTVVIFKLSQTCSRLKPTRTLNNVLFKANKAQDRISNQSQLPSLRLTNLVQLSWSKALQRPLLSNRRSTLQRCSQARTSHPSKSKMNTPACSLSHSTCSERRKQRQSKIISTRSIRICRSKTSPSHSREYRPLGKQDRF